MCVTCWTNICGFCSIFAFTLFQLIVVSLLNTNQQAMAKMVEKLSSAYEYSFHREDKCYILKTLGESAIEEHLLFSFDNKLNVIVKLKVFLCAKCFIVGAQFIVAVAVPRYSCKTFSMENIQFYNSKML